MTVDWAVRDTVRAGLRVMVKTLLKRYRYPPDKQEEATETVLKQAESLLAQWVAAQPRDLSRGIHTGWVERYRKFEGCYSNFVGATPRHPRKPTTSLI